MNHWPERLYMASHHIFSCDRTIESQNGLGWKGPSLDYLASTPLPWAGTLGPLTQGLFSSLECCFHATINNNLWSQFLWKRKATFLQAYLNIQEG